MAKLFGNIVGAFADGAILFPLLAALSIVNGFSGATLLATAGIAYIVAGLIFRIPFSVQPLKSIAIAAIALGASQVEVRAAGALLGLTCFVLSFLPINQFVSKIPRPLIHGVQLGLGILLITQGVKIGFPIFSTQPIWWLVLMGLIGAMLFTSQFSVPLLGIVATGGLFYALFFAHSPFLIPQNPISDTFRISILLTLLLPQLVLTFSNSVVATYDVANRYFPGRSQRVTPKRLLQSIGLGNILSALVGGLPFCHGSGGLTAHVKGGATHFVSNLIIGGTLLILSIIQFTKGSISLAYPPVLLSSLLVTTGLFHIQLAHPTWEIKTERLRLVMMGIMAVISQNMLCVLAVGVFPEILKLFSLLRPLKTESS